MALNLGLFDILYVLKNYGNAKDVRYKIFDFMINGLPRRAMQNTLLNFLVLWNR